MSVQRPAVPLSLIIADSAKLVASPEFASQVPSLARLAGRGVVREADATAVQRAWTAAELSILDACDLLEHIDEFPSGALCALTIDLGEDQARAQQSEHACWAHADAVHFSAGLTDLAGLQLRDHAAVSDEEHLALSELLRSHFGADCELHTLRSGNWLLRFPRVLHAQTHAPQHAFRGPLQHALPNGADGAELRRLMTELQMVVHDATVNQARARRGLPAINAFWIWGLGVVPAVPTDRALPRAHGSSAFLNGLYRLHGKTVAEGAPSLDALLTEHGHDQALLALVDEVEPAVLESQWFTPLERALRGGSIKRAVVHFDRWRVDVQRGDLLRFWRKHWAPTERAA